MRNVTTVTADVNTFGTGETAGVVAAGFDRIVTVEMLEHVRNHRAMLGRVAGWLRDDGRLFAHVFAHREVPYLFEVGGTGDWMARHFFTGGMMPSHDLLVRAAPASLAVDGHWVVDGTHYAATCEAWLDRLNVECDAIVALFARDLGRRRAVAQWRRWRTFTLACAELFAFDGGREWFVSHVAFTRA